MFKRSGIIFCAILFLFAGMIVRIYGLADGSTLSTAAAKQGSYTITPVTKRGMIYDCHFRPLVNTDVAYTATVVPSPEALNLLIDKIPAGERGYFMKKMEEGRPFITPLTDSHVFSNSVLTFEKYSRYPATLLAPHIIGYVDSTGAGVTGVERAYDEILRQAGGQYKVTYQVDAVGRALETQSPVMRDENYTSRQGVVLTIDSRLQSIAREALAAATDKGAAIIMDVHTGDIEACVSLPDYHPDTLGAVVDSPDGELLNRAFLGYNVGSTFKLVVAAAALEAGLDGERLYTCTGQEDVSGVVFHCNKLTGHGEISLRHAIEVSCNTYFINLCEEIGYERVYATAKALGFGTSWQFMTGTKSVAASLPYPGDLQGPAESANISFGQGKLTATPLQIACLMSTIANGGYSVSPSLVLGISDSTGKAMQSFERKFGVDQVLGTDTVGQLQSFMVDVMQTGSGRNSQPEHVTAAAKTATAETGIRQNGRQIVHAWFAGFAPAENPRYAIVVFLEGGGSGALAAGPVFKAIADQIYLP